MLKYITRAQCPGAQALRGRDPIRAGALSTNWNWLGGLALIPLAGLATSALTPPTGLTAAQAAHLLLTTTVTPASADGALPPPAPARHRPRPRHVHHAEHAQRLPVARHGRGPHPHDRPPPLGHRP